MSSWHSYPKVYNVGHPQVSDILKDYVVIQEKVDGSQFSFGTHDGKLMMRSKGRQFSFGEEDNLFKIAAAQAKELYDKGLLSEGFTYRCEYLAKPKHNTICYDSIPMGNLSLFDVEIHESTFLGKDIVRSEADRLCIGVVPTLFEGDGPDVNMDMITGMLNETSFLGGSKIEGVVIKNYSRFTRDGKVMMAKHVSEAFKEVHRTDWKDRHPKKKDIYDLLVYEYRTPARWSKAVQHMLEDGRLTNSPRDIGELIKEVQRDIKEECADEIKKKLFSAAWKTVGRGVVRGLPEWYKEQLLKNQLEE